MGLGSAVSSPNASGRSPRSLIGFWCILTEKVASGDCTWSLSTWRSPKKFLRRGMECVFKYSIVLFSFNYLSKMWIGVFDRIGKIKSNIIILYTYYSIKIMASKRGLYKKATVEGSSTMQNEKRCGIYIGIISISRYRDINRQPHMATISYDRLRLRYINTTTSLILMDDMSTHR